jgi:putative NADH-flavin reductase
MARVLIVGASRGIGLEAVRCALAEGHRVRAFARGAASIAIDHPELERRSGNALSPAEVAQAVQDVEAVIQALGAPRDAGTALWGTTLFSAATRVLIDAMRAQGTRRLVAVTGLGAGDSRGRLGAFFDWVAFPLVLKRIYDDKDVQEQMIKASGLDWTIVRPGLLKNGPATGRVRALTDPEDWRAGVVRRADVAQFLVREAFGRRFVGKTPLLIE